MSSVVEVRNLTKSYGSVMAVNQVSFSIDARKIPRIAQRGCS